MAASADPCERDADSLSQLIHRREISCRELMGHFLARIETLNPQVNALVSMRPRAELLAEADEHDAALAAGEDHGWLHGLPIAVKDLSDVAGLPTTMGSPIMRNNVAARDGLITARMRAAGAIPIGKTNTPEFGLGSQTYNTVFGTTRNAWDPALCAGGSSGGAAVALALRMLPVADGSDMGGSLRNPAAYGNIYGFRPSMGRVPKHPAPERFFQQLGTEGPMGRTVTDIARLFAILAGSDPRTPLALAGDGSAFIHVPEWQSEPIRVGWLADLDGYLPMETGVLALCETALGAFEGAGARVEPVAPTALGPAPEDIWIAWVQLRSLLVGGTLRAFYENPAQRELLKPEARWEVENAQGTGALDVYAASVVRTALYDALCALFERHDVLALPSAQVFAFDAAQHWPDSIAGRSMDTYHRWMEVVIYATLAGCPVISVPAGFDSRGRAMGLQLIGRPRGDAELLSAARVYEQANDWATHRPVWPDT